MFYHDMPNKVLEILILSCLNILKQIFYYLKLAKNRKKSHQKTAVAVIL